MWMRLVPSSGVYRGQSDQALPKEVQVGACSEHGIFPVGSCICCAWWVFCAQSCWAVVLIANALTRPLDSHQRNELAFSSGTQPCVRAVVHGWSRVSVLCLHFCTSFVVNSEMWYDTKLQALAVLSKFKAHHFRRCHLPLGESLKEIDGLPGYFFTPGCPIVKHVLHSCCC